MSDKNHIDSLRTAASAGRVEWHLHAFERLIVRGITRAEVLRAIIEGEMIEMYSDDTPFPSCLLLNVEGEPLHVVAAIDTDRGTCHVITAYRPDLEHFDPDFRTRRRR